MEAQTKELIKAEKENSMKQFNQLTPNFDPCMLKHPIAPIPTVAQEQSSKNPISDKASGSGATHMRPLSLEDENTKLDNAKAQPDEMVNSLNFCVFLLFEF